MTFDQEKFNRKYAERIAKPGVIIISRADWDGWPVGQPFRYIGPVSFEDYLNSEKFSGNHYTWEPLEVFGED